MRQIVSKCTKYSLSHLVLIYLDLNMTISYYYLHSIIMHQINRNGARNDALDNFDATWFYFIRPTTQSLDVIIVFDQSASKTSIGALKVSALVTIPSVVVSKITQSVHISFPCFLPRNLRTPLSIQLPLLMYLGTSTFQTMARAALPCIAGHAQ